MSALSIGVRLELYSMSFYKKQSEESPDPFVKRFFGELAEWEAGHYHALLKQLDALKDFYWEAAGFSPF
jgi:rubrerythrin